MPISPEAREIANAINGNTRELKKLREAIERSNKAVEKNSKTVNNFVQNLPREPLDLETPEYDQ